MLPSLLESHGKMGLSPMIRGQDSDPVLSSMEGACAANPVLRTGKCTKSARVLPRTFWPTNLVFYEN